MPSDDALRAKAQQTLIELLHTELGLGPAFVQSALLAKSAGYMEQYIQAKQHAVKAADAVRHFIEQVADEAARTKIGKDLAELDRLISTL